MASTYKVRIRKIEVRRNAHGKVTSYRVRWMVDGNDFRESFEREAAADSFRSDLIAAQRAGERFDTVTGRPVSWRQTDRDMGWYDFSVKYVDMKWPDSAATARQGIAESLIRVMPVFVPDVDGAPDAKELRSALRGYGYNTKARTSGVVPDDSRATLDWCSRRSKSVRSAAEPETLRRLQRAVTRRLDGKPFAPTVARKTRSVLWNVLEYAVEEDLLDVNPLAGVKWTAMPKGKRKVDKRAVPNPIQARTLLAAVEQVQRSGPRLKAFFGAMYYAALRPEEVVALNKRHLSLPKPKWDSEKKQLVYDWGELNLDFASPHAGSVWTDSGKPRDERTLKSRSADEGRTVPCSPELTQLLLEHMEKFGVAPNGNVFQGRRGGDIPMITYTRAWRAARKLALTEEVQATPLAARPYDLRHAAVSTWLMGGVDPAMVAEWAGHSYAVLMETYAAFVYGRDVVARRQVMKALGHKDPEGE